jgi:hypothetical protein
MQAYTYEQLPASTQGIARQQMTEYDKTINFKFWATVTAGLKRRGLPARELGPEHSKTRLTGDYMGRLPLRTTNAEAVYRNLHGAGIEVYLDESQDGMISVVTEHTMEQMARAIDVPIDTIRRFRNYITSVVEEDIKHARKDFISEAMGIYGMPPLFTARGEKITYDLYE